jgi:histidinol-phosphate phosphatase family protein
MYTLVVIDRDGTLIKDPYGYFPHGFSNWRNNLEFYDRVFEGLKLLQESGIYLAVITNQSGVALGLIEERDVIDVNNAIAEEMEVRGIKLPFFYCIEIPPEYAREHEIARRDLIKATERRKPGIGMVLEAARYYGIDGKEYQVFSIGDKDTDVLTGINAGGYGVLVKTGEYESSLSHVEELARLYPERVFIAENFYQACELIVRKS